MCVICDLTIYDLQKSFHIHASSANVYMFSPLRGSHHTPVHPTGVDTPACVVASPMGLGTYASCGYMHTHYGAREPRRGDYSTGTGENPCVQCRNETRNPEGVTQSPWAYHTAQSVGKHQSGKIPSTYPKSLKKFYLCICRMYLD